MSDDYYITEKSKAMSNAHKFNNFSNKDVKKQLITKKPSYLTRKVESNANERKKSFSESKEEISQRPSNLQEDFKLEMHLSTT